MLRCPYCRAWRWQSRPHAIGACVPVRAITVGVSCVDDWTETDWPAVLLVAADGQTMPVFVSPHAVEVADMARATADRYGVPLQ